MCSPVYSAIAFLLLASCAAGPENKTMRLTADGNLPATENTKLSEGVAKKPSPGGSVDEIQTSSVQPAQPVYGPVLYDPAYDPAITEVLLPEPSPRQREAMFPEWKKGDRLRLGRPVEVIDLSDIRKAIETDQPVQDELAAARQP